MDDNSLRQERWLLSLTGRPRPAVLFLGTAGGDGVVGQAKFFRAFTQLDCRPSSLLFFPYDMQRDYRRAVLDADLVYVGGGNTPAMLAVWREFGFDTALREAYDDGTVMADRTVGGCRRRRGGPVRAGSLGRCRAQLRRHAIAVAARAPRRGTRACRC